jgi:hypothetical protein
LAHVLDAFKTQSFERLMDRPALGVENALLQGNVYARLHRPILPKF